MILHKELLDVSKRKAKPAENELAFGRFFMDHMLLMDYTPEVQAWHNARIVPYAPFAMSPASLVLHYGQEVFEGMKAYRRKDHKIGLFRPQDNISRLNDSCRRLCIPELPADDVFEALCELIRIDQDWIPKGDGTSLYIRPTVIASEASLGVKVSSSYTFFVIAGPVGAYYAEGVNPIKIWVEETYVRAAEGGLGEAKTMANYAASMLATKRAKERGFTQVLWLDARDRRYVEEVGTMNMFFKIAGEVITAPLDGTILPGVTRRSVIQLCKDMQIPVSERRISIDEVIEAQQNGTLEEAFGTGTAAVISPVGELFYRDHAYRVGNGQTGEISKKMYDELTGIQTGARPDPHHWTITL